MNIKLLDIICTVYPDRGNPFVYIVDRISDMIYHASKAEAERIFNEILNDVSPDMAEFLLKSSPADVKLAILDDASLTDGKKVMGRVAIKPSTFLAEK